MPYIEETYYAGDTIEKRKFYAKRTDAAEGVREELEKPNRKEIERVNLRNAERKLRLALNGNFEDGDYNITLTYGTDAPPPTWEQAKKDWERFLRRLRKLYAGAGHVLKWIVVTAVGKVHGRIHHHLICSKGVPLHLIQSAWGLGKARAGTLDTDGQYHKLAVYLIGQKRAVPEEGEHIQRWSSSRNLTPPKVERRTVKAKTWREQINPPIGYYEEVDARYVGIDKFGHPTVEYRFKKIAPTRKHRK